MSDSQIIEILSNSDMFQMVSPINVILRWLGWELIKILAFLSNGVETVVNEIYSLNGFFSSKYINDLINNLLPLIWVILAVSIAFLGFKIIFDREFKINNLIKNIVIAVSIVMLLPMGMNHLEKITSQAVSGLKTEYKLSANKIIKENFYDLYYLDTVNFKSKSKNNIPVEKITSNIININEEITNDSDIENKDIFKYKVTTDLSGKNDKQKLDKVFFGMFSENYYRFNFDFWGIFVSLACTTVTLLATSFKVARIIFELGFVKLFGILYSFVDISDGQKTKEIIRCIVSNFAILFLISVLLKMYLLFTTWSIEQSTSLTQIVLLIGASIAVIDGPNIIERILGIDSGVKNGWSVATGGYTTANGMANGVKTASTVMGKALSGVSNIGSGAVGLVNGFKEGSKSLEDQMSASSKTDVNSTSNASTKSSIQDEINSDELNSSSYESDTKDSSDMSSNNQLNTSDNSDANKRDTQSEICDKNTSSNENINDKNTLSSEMEQGVKSNSIDNNNEDLNNNSGLGTLESDMNNNNNDGMPSNIGASTNKLESDMNNNDDVPSNIGASTNKLESDMNNNDDVPSNIGASTSKLESDMNNNNIDSSMNTASQQSDMNSQVPQSKLNNSINNTNIPGKESNDKTTAVENRTLSNHIKNNMVSNPTIKNMQQSYNVGKNTGVSISNIIKNRKQK